MADRNCPQCKGRGFTTNAKGQAVAVCPACSGSVKPVGPDLKNYKKPAGPAVDSEPVGLTVKAAKTLLAKRKNPMVPESDEPGIKAGYKAKDAVPFVFNPALTNLAEKVGVMWRSAPNTYEGLDAAKVKISAAIKAAGTTPKELAAYITKMSTANRRRVNVSWLARLTDSRKATDKQWPACQEGRHQFNGKSFCGRCGEPKPKDVPVGDRRSRLHAALDAVMTYSKPPVIRKTLSILNPNDLAKMTGSSEPQYIGKGKPYTGFAKDETPQEKARRKLSPEQAARLKELLAKVKPAPSAAAPMPRAKDSQHWMPETGNHALADKLHAQLTGEGFSPAFGSGNKAGDITYRYEKGKERAYLLARRNGQHTIERKAAGAYGKGLSKDVAAKKCHGCGKPTAGYYCAACEKKADTGYSKLAKDSSDFEVKKGRSGNWALFKPGSDYPESNWFLSKAKAAEELKRRGGKVSSKKEPAEEPDIFGYPWEYIQAMQRGDRLGAQKILLKRNSLDSDLQPV